MYGQNPQYGYGAPMFGYGQSPGLYIPQQPMNYQPSKPSFGEQLARLGLSAASQGIGVGVRDWTVDAMQEGIGSGSSVGEKAASPAGGAEKAAATTVGTAAGAGLGSIVPGVGTAVGGAVGGALGGLASLFFEEEQEEPQRRPMLPPPAQPYMVRPKSSYGGGFAQQYGVQNPYGFRMG